MDFDETVQYLYDLQKFGTKLGLENTRALMDILGSPERSCGFLHVAGTNGKGSVSAMAESILRAAGHKTGLYTSPHLVSFTERIKVGGVEVTEAGVAALAERLRGLLDKEAPGLKPTFFEYTTAMALDYFREKGAEVVVLEVGMGGRLDSTNVVTPECTVITNVDVEHREYLGDTLMDIVPEKAGIIKPGVPVVCTETKPDVIEYIEAAANSKGAPFHLIGREFWYANAGSDWTDSGPTQTFDYLGPGGALPRLEIRLAGGHQISNAAAAVCAVRLMSGRGYPVDDDAIRTGLKEAVWEGRLEVVSNSPLTVFDGAHNPASVKALADAVREVFKGRYRRLVLVMGVLADKDFSEMFDMLAPLADSVVFTRSGYERSQPAETLLAAARGKVADAHVAGSVAQALDIAAGIAAPQDMVLLTGSLYIVGEAKAAIQERRQFLRA